LDSISNKDSFKSITSAENLNFSSVGTNVECEESILFVFEIDMDANEQIKGFNIPNNDTGFIKYELSLNVKIII